MKTFSPSEAAFEGFRVIRNHPGAVLAWAVAYVAVYVVFALAALTLLGADLVTFFNFANQASAASPPGQLPPEMMGVFAHVLGVGFLVFVPLGLIAGAIFINAVYRPILRPQDKGLFFLKISGDEWRLILLILAYVGLFIVTEIGCGIVLALVLGILTAVAVSGHMPALFLLHAAVILAFACLAVWVAVRLSLAAPMTFAQKHVRVFGSWSVTKGKFWSLLGCYVLAWIFAILVGILGWVISVSASATITGDWTPFSTVMTNPRMAMAGAWVNTITHLFTVATIVQVVISCVMGAVSRVIMYAPLAAAYRDLTTAPSDGEARAQGLVS